MGLDAVELVMEVEDHFGITIDNDEPEPILTVGDLVALVHRRVQVARENRCLSLPFFLKLRRTVREITGDGCLRIRPHEAVVQRLSTSERRMLWKRLPSLFNFYPAGLQRPRWLRWSLFTLAVVLLMGALLLGVAIDPLILPLTFALAVLGIMALLWMTLPFRTVPPYGWTTFGEITLHLVGTVAATKQLNLRTADEVLAELRPIIANILGVAPSQVVPSARFVEDLGMS